MNVSKSESNKKWRLANPEKWREINRLYAKKWRAKNKKRTKELKKAEYERNQEKYLQRSKAWRETNREQYLQRMKDCAWNKKQETIFGQEFIKTFTCHKCGIKYLPKLGCLLCDRECSYERMKNLGLSTTLRAIYDDEFAKEEECELV